MLEGDCFAALGDLADDSVQLTFTSPPYDIGKAYETRREMSDYLEPCGELLKTLRRDQGAALIDHSGRA